MSSIFQDHQELDCPEVINLCPKACGRKVKLKDLHRHFQQECERAEKVCSFAKMGCNKKLLQTDMDKHVETAKSEHLQLMVQYCALLEQKIQDANKKMEMEACEHTELKQRHEEAQRQREELMMKLAAKEANEENHERIMAEVQAQMSVLEQRIEELHVGAHTGQERNEVVGNNGQTQTSVTTSQANMEVMQTQVASIYRQVGNFNTLLRRTGAILSEFDLRLFSQETASFSGILIWKIPNYNQHFEQAKRGEKVSLYSPPFYTSRHGYKMCARAYLNGDGVGKSTHLSVFFVVMRGEFDFLLSWPFAQKVTLSLLDQSPAKRHISETFLPDTSSSSFQRPTSEMNIASGCPRFVSLQTIQSSTNYTKENTVFLRVTVDCTSLLID